MENGARKMTFGKYKDTHTFEKVADEDSDYCQWCMSTMKPSSKMAEFKEYLRTRRKEPFDLKPEPQPKAEQKARGKRNVSEDEEWTPMDTSTSPSTAPSHSENAASMTALLDRVLHHADQHPGTTRPLKQMIQMVREQWSEVNKNSIDMMRSSNKTIATAASAEAKAWTEKDPELIKLAVGMRR